MIAKHILAADTYFCLVSPRCRTRRRKWVLFTRWSDALQVVSETATTCYTRNYGPHDENILLHICHDTHVKNVVLFTAKKFYEVNTHSAEHHFRLYVTTSILIPNWYSMCSQKTWNFLSLQWIIIQCGNTKLYRTIIHISNQCFTWAFLSQNTLHNWRKKRLGNGRNIINYVSSGWYQVTHMLHLYSNNLWVYPCSVMTTVITHHFHW